MGLPSMVTNRWLRNNGIINETFKVTNPIEEVLKFPLDDADITSKNYDIS